MTAITGRRQRTGLVFAAPALALFLLFAFLPFLHSVYLSFFSWNGLTEPRAVGLDNYVRIFADTDTSVSFVHAFVMVLFYAGLTTVVAFLLAAIMGSTTIRAMPFFRTVLFLPYVIAPAAVGVIWRWLLSPDGPVNAGLSAIGLGAWVRPWLGDFEWALPSVGMIGTWMMCGVVMVLLLAGVQSIPRELYEAARLDGAGFFAEARAVTLPHLRPEIVVALVLTATAALRNFDLIYVTTRGGPGSSTVVPSWLVYHQAFVVGDVGRGAAMAVILTVVVVAVSAAILAFGRERNA